MTKLSLHIMGGRKEKHSRLFYQTPPNLAPQNYGTKIFETNKKYTENSNTGKLEPGEGKMELSTPG